MSKVIWQIRTNFLNVYPIFSKVHNLKSSYERLFTLECPGSIPKRYFTCHGYSDTNCGPNQKCQVRQFTILRGNANYELCDDSDSEEHYAGSDYEMFMAGKQYGKSVATKKMQEVFKCTLKHAELMVKKHPGLLLISSDNITENMKYLDSVGVERSILKDNPWLLTFKTSAITTRLNCIRRMGLNDVNVAVPLLQIPLNRLRDISYWAEKEAAVIPEGSRIYHISKSLDCDPSEVCQVVAKHLFMQKIPFERIEEILQLLLRYGVLAKYVLKDIWVFLYNPQRVEDRLQKAHAAGVKNIKPWVVRCPESVFLNTLRRQVESQKALGTNSNITEYLSQRLECSTDNIATLSLRYPLIMKVHVLKIKEVLDYLYEEGFTPQQVCQVPRVLCHSLETIQERLNQIRDLGHNPSTLIVLCRSKRQYTEYINKLSSKKQSLSGDS